MGSFPVQELEYKSPSYELCDRTDRFVIDETEYQNKSRYILGEQGLYRSKQADKDCISLLFAGDLLCQENILYRYQTKAGGYDFKLCFDYIKPLFESADFVAGNLETPVSDMAPYRGEIFTHEGPFYCNAPTEYLDALSYAGFDLLTTANNHTLDAGMQGLLDTIRNAKRFGFMQTGTFAGKEDKFIIVDICGFKVGFAAFSLTYNSMQDNLTKEGRITFLNTFTKNRAKEVYQAMKEKGAEFTVCFPHWGKEFTDVISLKQSEMAHTFAALGYDIVVGAHSHVVQKFQNIKQTPTVFSIGNLLSHCAHGKKKTYSEYPVLCHLTLKRTVDGIQSKLDFIPCMIVKNYQKIPFTIVPCAKQLPLPKDLEEKLADVPQTVAKLLCTSDSALINTNYPIQAEFVTAFVKQQKTLRDRVETLLPRKKTTISAEEPMEEPEIPKQRFWEKSFHYAVEKGCLCKVFSNHAELVKFKATAPVIRLGDLVGDTPLTVIANIDNGNDTARVIYLGKKVKTIQKACFRGYTALESVRLRKGLETIEQRAFEGCTAMTGIIMPSTVTTIEDHAFADCSSLLSIKLPKSVKSIGKNAFAGCPKLTIYCEKGSFADQYAQSHQIPVKYMPLT